MYLSGVVHALGDSDVEGLLSRVLCGISTWYVARCYETPQPNTRLWLVGSPFYVSACVQLCRGGDGRERMSHGETNAYSTAPFCVAPVQQSHGDISKTRKLKHRINP